MGSSSAMLTWVFLAAVTFVAVSGQCPWHKSVPELRSMCACVVDAEEKLSVQCTDANFPLLMTSLHKMVRTRKMDLLFVNDSDIGVLNSRIFEGLHIENIQVKKIRISYEIYLNFTYQLRNLFSLFKFRLIEFDSAGTFPIPFQ